MENSSIQNRMKKLEHKHAPNAKEDTGIPITPEAQILLEPWYNAVLGSKENFRVGIMEYTPEDLFTKCVAEETAMTTDEGFCGSDEGVIGIEVAERVIEKLKGLGINI